MYKLFKIILLLFFLIPFSQAKELDKVSLQLQWLDQFQFAGYYIAKEKGYYQEVNLDVEIRPYKSGLNILDDVMSQKATFATGRTSLLIHKNNGHPVVALAAIFQHSPAALLVTNESIIRPNNLINKRVMISPDAITSASYMSMLFSEGILKDNIIVQQHSYNIEDLINEKTDAIASYISNEPYQLKKRGVKYRYFHPKDYGFDFYGDILYTSKYMLEKNPKRVEDFTMASIKGWEYAFKNIEETAQLIYSKYNTQNKSLDALIFEGETLRTLAYDKNGEIGPISKERFDDIAKTYRLFGMLDKNYTTEGFIKDIHSLSKTELNPQEKEWLLKNNKITLATNKEWNPVEFFNKNGIYSGIASGYLEKLKEHLDLEFTIANGKYWYEMINGAKSKKVDMFMAIVPTPNRKDFLEFTSSYIEFPTVIVTQSHIGYIKNLFDLNHKTVAVEKSFYTNELIHAYNNKINLLPVNTTAEALKLVSNGTAYAYIGSLPNIGYFLQKLKLTNLKISGEAPFKTRLSFATRKDLPILKSILQKTLNKISEEEHNAIYNRWINIKYEYEIDYKVVIVIATIAFLILLLFYNRNKALKKELLLRERFSTKLKSLNKSLENKNIILKELSENDSLTKLANRRKIDFYLDKESERSVRNNLSLSIIMLDIDHFKKVNDTYGHKIGDRVLVSMAKVLEENTRSYELVGRWGGEEFIIICPNSSLKQAHKLAKKIHQIIISQSYDFLNNNGITICCGVAQFKKNESIDDFIQRADAELYKAKHNGRNSVYPQI